ncbi:hypothetical protein Ae201684P_009701 [Aphanomyces euteiches]|nr:hypothetical protein Ae201684P_009701 [Aphanomyces euteiches]
MEDIVLFCVGIFQVWITPYAKVEESFNLQACHDLLFHQFNLTQYDHFAFPGVVPRTFLGALPVSLISSPLLVLVSKPAMQMTVRACLWLFAFLAWRSLKRTISSRFGNDTGVWFTVITLVQFHLVYYMSRTLPNIFALVSICRVGPHTAVIFAPILLSLLINQQISFLAMIGTGIASAFLALASTVLVDSYFWQRWLWPEGEVLWFNTVLNKSHEWGTHPFHWYFTSAFPRIMLATAVLIPLGATSLGTVVSSSKSPSVMFQNLRGTSCLDLSTCQYLIPIVVYVFLFSFLPHKELRFVLNASCFNDVIAINIWPLMLAFGCIFVTAAGSVVFTIASHLNYPGVAFAKLHELAQAHQNESIMIHIDVASAMTGVSRFGEQYPAWTYTEDLTSASDFNKFDYILTAAPTDSSKQDFKVIEAIEGFDRVDYRKLSILTKPQIYMFHAIFFNGAQSDENKRRYFPTWRSRVTRLAAVMMCSSNGLAINRDAMPSMLKYTLLNLPSHQQQCLNHQSPEPATRASTPRTRVKIKTPARAATTAARLVAPRAAPVATEVVKRRALCLPTMRHPQ